MIRLAILVWALLAPPPAQLQVSTARGVERIALMRRVGDGPMVPLGPLAHAVGGTIGQDGAWVTLATDAGHFKCSPDDARRHRS